MTVSYDGQSQRGIETYNFGGINRKATIVNLKDGEARDIVNFDIDITGGIKRRAGRIQTAALAQTPRCWMCSTNRMGQKVFVPLPVTSSTKSGGLQDLHRQDWCQ